HRPSAIGPPCDLRALDGSKKELQGNGKESWTSESGTQVLPPRRRLVAAARRVLWGLLRDRARGLETMRSARRRRLAELLWASDGRRLLRVLRSAALAAAVVAALLGPSSVRAQAIELSDIAHGEGGFVARGDGEPASGAGSSVADAGDVNGDGIPDLIIGGGH